MGQRADGQAVLAGSWAPGSPRGSHASREIPRRGRGSAALPAGILLPQKGPPSAEPLPLGERENKILPLCNVVIQLPDQSL